ncbi:MAG: hypothetical protein BWK80_08405 [Desulfobacteraceae bacterium IS3]|jgi:hypothetical protein|nr:MAG: hypothetical protein BWK80_08405 [Desulfobacteraceae bacterium IS3]HAO20210.1 hypothetical protein [Desulfobacteraceae bacterium]
MMSAVEFETVIRDGMIKIPSSYIHQIAGSVRVIILKQEQCPVHDVYEEIIAISKRCSDLSDYDTRSADEILGYK